MKLARAVPRRGKGQVLEVGPGPDLGPKRRWDTDIEKLGEEYTDDVQEDRGHNLDGRSDGGRDDNDCDRHGYIWPA